jgi:hypothetical protein
MDVIREGMIKNATCTGGFSWSVKYYASCKYANFD